MVKDNQLDVASLNLEDININFILLQQIVVIANYKAATLVMTPKI